MNDAAFFKNFRYTEYRYNKTQSWDNSRGIDMHYIGRMKHGKGRIISEGQTQEIHENEMFYIPKGCRYHSYWIADNYVMFDSIGFLYFPTRNPNGYVLQKIEQNQGVREAFAPLSESKALHTASIGTLYCLLAFSHCIAGVMRGAGKATVPMFTMLACWCLFRVTYISIAVKLVNQLTTVS